MLKNILLFFAGGGILFFFCQEKLDGFSERHIYTKLDPNFSWQGESFFFDQPFFYLGSGVQNFAFVSKDGQYVLKFYRNERASHPLKWFRRFSKSLDQTISKREMRREKSYRSYRIAGEKLAEQTGLLMVHLCQSNCLQKRVKIYDKIGVEHIVDLDKVPFLLQKKAEPFYPTLEEWIANGEIERAKVGLKTLVSHLKKRAELGISDKDPDFETNFGFLGNLPIEFDVGRFREGSDAEEPIRVTDPLCSWVEVRSTELAQFVRSFL